MLQVWEVSALFLPPYSAEQLLIYLIFLLFLNTCFPEICALGSVSNSVCDCIIISGCEVVCGCFFFLTVFQEAYPSASQFSS